MTQDSTPKPGRMIQIDEGQLQAHLDELVRGIVEETLKGLVDAEADALCNAPKYRHSPERVDTRARHYTCTPQLLVHSD